MVAAAIAGSAVAGLAGSAMSSSAAGKAGKQQADAANRAADMQAQQAAQVRQDLSPYRDFGQNALGLLGGIFGSQTPTQTTSTTTGGTAQGDPSNGGLPAGWSFFDPSIRGGGMGSDTPPHINDAQGNAVYWAPNMDELHKYAAATYGNGGAGSGGTTTTTTTPGGYNGTGGNILTANGLSGLTFQPTQAQLESTPGYQFIRAQGLQSVQNGNAAKGLGLSGAALKGAGQYATGLASQTLGQQQGIFQSNLHNILDPLEWAANLGQTAATQTGQNSLQSTANQGNMITSGAAASAAGQVGSSNALAGGLNSLGGAGQNYLLMNQLAGKSGGSVGEEGGRFDV
jgi:hypothetical protein